ncbi:MAG: sigma 54-interacting transcriptional regulator, partial [Deltaproteobacteria bacterium]|nr:sigma 54-interacting transcriptional regulator [Deltaproteobacteria bacterium]
MKINCASIPKDLLESELFGYNEGAFTGSRKGGKIGKFELSDRGTIFLDEIWE